MCLSPRLEVKKGTSVLLGTLNMIRNATGPANVPSGVGWCSVDCLVVSTNVCCSQEDALQFEVNVFVGSSEFILVKVVVLSSTSFINH